MGWVADVDEALSQYYVLDNWHPMVKCPQYEYFIHVSVGFLDLNIALP